jgi:sugar lactone lactonase YvrE
MKKNLLALVVICLNMFQFASAQSYNGAESVEFDYAHNRYLVSNTSSKKIIARAADGTLSNFASLSIAPYGIEIVGDTLYCCTSTSITAINLNNGVQVFNQVIATGSVFLNGITHDPAGNLYCTGFSSNKVYRFNTANRQFNVFINNTISQPNGIIYDSYDGITPRLVMASWGPNAAIKAINLADSTMTTLITTPFGSIDGIAKGKNGNFYIACWSNNTIQRYDSTFANAPTGVVTSGISSPADIYYNQLTDTLAVPFGANVNFYFFGTLTNQNSLLSESEINFYPNPNQGLIYINNVGAQKHNLNCNIYEIGTGKLVFSQNLFPLNNTLCINLSDKKLSTDLYLFELGSSEGLIARQKITFE